MNGIAASPRPRRLLRALSALFACGAILAALASPAASQKEKKKKKDSNAPAEKLSIPMPDEQRIDYRISEMLGAWQLGDVDRLHEVYADDAVFVSGIWEPPVFGWTNYLPVYQRQRARMQQVRMDRVNTFIKVNGAVGWACYQWDFGGTVDGQPMTSRGQTTLVFEKRNNLWVIVHNHTSAAQGAPTTTQPQPAPASPANIPPATQPEASKPPAT